MHRVWFRALLSGLFCLGIGVVAFSCQWLSSEKGPPDEPITRVEKSREPQLPSPSQSDSSLESIRRRGELKVGMQVGYAPFEMLGSGGSVEGFDVDMAAMIAHALGVGLRIVRQDWQDLIPSLLKGETDLIMSAMTITPERNLKVVFTEPVIETGRMFLVHKKEAERFGSFKELNQPGVFVASREGGLGSIQPKEELPLVAVRMFKDKDIGIKEVIEGRAHAYVDEEFAVRMACAKHPGTLIGRFEALTYEPIAWAVRPNDLHWLNWLNNFIRSARRDSTLDKLKKKWLRDYFLDLGARRG